MKHAHDRISSHKMRVLITNTDLVQRSGSGLYVRDIARALLARNYAPIVYSPRLGGLAEAIRNLGVPVVDDLNTIGAPPDIIHGHHHLETMTVLAHFPAVPAIYVCHGWLPWEETPPRHPRILRYVAVSELTRTRLVDEAGIQPDQISILPNFVDMDTFLPRAALQDVPRRALIFSNQAARGNYVDTIQSACDQLGIAFDVIGLANGNPEQHPEKVLGHYDVVFARGRAALEALAVGAAVITCDIEGAGQMVTTDNLDWHRRHNMGLRVLTRPVSVRVIMDELARYDAGEAMRVSALIRSQASLSAAVDALTGIYADVLARRETAVPDPAAESAALSAYFAWLSRSVPHELGQQNSQMFQQIERMSGEHNRLIGQVNEMDTRSAQALQARDEIIRERDEVIRARDQEIHLLHEAIAQAQRAVVPETPPPPPEEVLPVLVRLYRTIVPLPLRLRLRTWRGRAQ